MSHRLNCVQSPFTAKGLRPFRKPINVVSEQPRAKNGSLFRVKNFFCLRKRHKIKIYQQNSTLIMH